MDGAQPGVEALLLHRLQRRDGGADAAAFLNEFSELRILLGDFRG
jgi:hypothetical protein